MTNEFSVLIVDDEKEIIEILAFHFEKVGAKIHSALNGKDALKVLNKQKIDAIVSDVRMPKMGGVELIEAVKSSDKTKDIPFFFITGYSDVSEDKAKELGAKGVISKPFHPGKIVQLILDVLS